MFWLKNKKVIFLTLSCFSEGVISEQSHKGTSLQRKYNSFVNFHVKKIGSHNITLLYPNPCGPQSQKTCIRGFAHKTGADKPALPRSLISPFVIRFL